jgi:DNA adenine methylase
MRVIIPPIKSQGIKTKLAPWIQELVPAVRGHWIEPFLGTGVVAFNSGFREALLSDINPHVIRFYQAVKDHEITPPIVREYLEKEGRQLEKAPDRGYAHFRSVRDRFNRTHDPLDFLFLSRAGFNGMMRFNRNGGWNIPFCKKPERFSRSYVTKIVNQVHDVACLIQPEWTFMAEDFEKAIHEATKDDIIYCAPPTSVATRTTSADGRNTMNRDCSAFCPLHRPGLFSRHGTTTISGRIPLWIPCGASSTS